MSSQPQARVCRLQAARMATSLAAGASLEIGALDFEEYPAARALLTPAARIYVSFLPGQDWRRTFQICEQIASDGFDPVPHIPVRLLTDSGHLDRVLGSARAAGVREPLLISGDYAEARGPFSTVLQVLQTGCLQAQGFQRLSLAGHPEEHPRVPWDVICEAQVAKWRFASNHGISVTFVTQFFFAVEPFVHWARFLRAAGVDARLVAGVAGPTGLGRLIKLSRHCGVGASMRALTSRPAAALRLFGEHAPDGLLAGLATERLAQPNLFDGLHVFSLGGFGRTAGWLKSARAG
jgi:methylenetetrahydrofolate reductase (NADPH)